jgi:hypothetical protein
MRPIRTTGLLLQIQRRKLAGLRVDHGSQILSQDSGPISASPRAGDRYSVDANMASAWPTTHVIRVARNAFLTDKWLAWIG